MGVDQPGRQGGQNDFEFTFVDLARVERTTVHSVRAGRDSPQSRRQALRAGAAGSIENPATTDWSNAAPSYAAATRSSRMGPEKIVVVLASIFLLLAVAKPWDLVIGSAQASPTERSAHAVINNPSDLAAMGEVPGWVVVDWTFLADRDDHSDWGFAWAEVPIAASALASLAPEISWTSSDGSIAPVEVSGGSDHQIFALAVTWPSSFDATSVSFEYLGTGSQASPLASPSNGPLASITPLRAELVTTPMPGSTGWGMRNPIVDTGPHSGEFLVAPYSPPQGVYTVSLSDAWYGSPWAWQSGDYRIALASASGKKSVMRLNLHNPTS